jgi:hypothetical protein
MSGISKNSSNVAVNLYEIRFMSCTSFWFDDVVLKLLSVQFQHRVMHELVYIVPLNVAAWL